MTRRLTVLFASFEALLVVGIGVAIPLVPLTLMWGLTYGFGPDWLMFWRASVDIWLIGHGVDIIVSVDPVLQQQLAVPGAEEPFPLTIAALGFAVLTLLLGIRAGGRAADTGHPIVGELTAFGVFALLSLGLAFTALDPAVRPSLTQSAILPALVFALGLLIGMLREGVSWAPGRATAIGSAVRDRIRALSPRLRATTAAAARAGAAAVSATVVVASLLVATLLFANYAQLIQLYEALHAGAVGGLALTAGQLAFVPNLVLWAASWLVGPGFAVGTGSSVSPLGTSLGPIPAVPVLGALPPDGLDYGIVGLLVPVLAAFFAGVALRRRLARELGDGGRAGRVVWFGAFIVAGALSGGLLLGLLAWASTGAAGPGRLVDVGPDPLMVGAVAAIEFLIGLSLGTLAGGIGRETLRRFAGHDEEERPTGSPGAGAGAGAEAGAGTTGSRRDGADEDAASSSSGVSAPAPAPPSVDPDAVDTAPVPVQRGR